MKKIKEKIITCLFNIFKKEILLFVYSKTPLIIEEKFKPITIKFTQQIDLTRLDGLLPIVKENVKQRQIEYVQREILEEVRKYIIIEEAESYNKDFTNFNGSLIIYKKDI